MEGDGATTGNDSLCERASRYIDGAKEALEDVKRKLGDSREYRSLLDAASRYLHDAEYYLDTGDCETGLVAVAYAEGLIDSLKYLGVLEPKWTKPAGKPRVFVAGTFDIIHPGHIDLLKYAASLGKVHVVIARDSTVERVKKKKPILDENTRLRIVGSIRYVYDARLGHPTDIMKPLEDIQPDIIVLGPDQPFDEEELANTVAMRIGKKPRVVRYPGKKSFAGGMKSTSDIIRKICSETYCNIHPG